MAFVIYLWLICDGVRIFCDGSIVFSAGLPHCFFLQCILSHFKGCCWLRSVFITTKIYIYLNTSLIMNVVYLKVTCGLHFHLLFFFSFLGAGLLMSFHGHSCPSIMIICIQPQTWSASGRGRGNGASRFFFFSFEKLGWWCPPASWCPKQTAYSAYRERRYWFLSSTISFISHRPDHKGTLASDLKGTGPPLCTPLHTHTFDIVCQSLSTGSLL